MDLSEQVREFRALQKTHKIRVADFCRERTVDYYEMVEALKKDKFLSELPKDILNHKKRQLFLQKRPHCKLPAIMLQFLSDPTFGHLNTIWHFILKI